MNMHNLLQEKDQEINRLTRQIMERDQEALKWRRITHTMEALKASHDATTLSHEEYELHPLEERLQVIKMQIQHDIQQLIAKNTILKQELEHYEAQLKEREQEKAKLKGRLDKCFKIMKELRTCRPPS